MRDVFWIVLFLHFCVEIIAFPGFLASSALRRCLRRPTIRRPHFRAPFLLQSFSTDSSFSEDDLSRWERMYNEGKSSAGLDLEESGIVMNLKSEVRIITFDLDNTLWKTYGCINAANDALAAFLDEHKIKQPKRVEKVMGDLFQANRTRYSPLLGEEATSATLLTLLRTDAIQKVLEEHNGYSNSDATAFAEKAFDVWATARHDAIPDNLVSRAVDCLEKICKLKTSQGLPLLIGAITDGNSDPRRVGILEKYFDFCVNAEQVGVSKPDKRVYLEAIRQAAAHPVTQDVISFDIESNDIEAGPYWVHVGDDFVKDIVAAKDLKMRTVWATELVRDKLPANLKTDATTNKTEAVDGKDVGDFLKKISDKQVVEMAIGADDYLADSFAREFVDAIAEEFHHLSSVIMEWHAEGVLAQPLDRPAQGSPSLRDMRGADSSTTADVEEFISVIVPDKPSETTVSGASMQEIPRAFRIIREDCSTDVTAPLRDRDTRTMKEVMGIAQLDRASGVFAFSPEDVEDVRVGSKVLMIKVEGTDLEFSREVFSTMTVQDILSLTEENPIRLSLYIKQAASAPSFDLF